MAQLVQWGGAPAALARDTELRGHAKRGARGAPCTSLASFPPPSPRAIDSPPLYMRFERAAPVSPICNVHSGSSRSELGPARMAAGHAPCLSLVACALALAHARRNLTNLTWKKGRRIETEVM